MTSSKNSVATGLYEALAVRNWRSKDGVYCLMFIQVFDLYLMRYFQ